MKNEKNDIKTDDERASQKYMDLIEEYSDKVSEGIDLSDNDLESVKSSLEKLLNVILKNTNESFRSRILKKLLLLLGKIIINKDKKKDKEEDVEKEWEELSEKEKEIRMKFIIYEIYKILNPRRVAGETSLENFINNVQARGIEVALSYASDGLLKKVDKMGVDVEEFESNRETFLEKVKKSGSIGFGKGL